MPGIQKVYERCIPGVCQVYHLMQYDISKCQGEIVNMAIANVMGRSLESSKPVLRPSVTSGIGLIKLT